MLKILYKGWIVENFDAPEDYNEGHTWYIGEILTINDSGTISKANDTTTTPVGLAMEMRQPPVGSDYTFDQTASSGKVSLLTGEALIETDVYESGVSFSINDVVKVGPNGRMTNTGEGQIIGRVREVSTNGVIKVFFRPSV